MDDSIDVTTIGLPVRSSVEKLHGAVGELGDVDVQDPGDAAMLTLLAGVAPMALGFLPDDPAELDELLLKGARLMLAMRSDDAWQPADLDELFLGPEPPR